MILGDVLGRNGVEAAEYNTGVPLTVGVAAVDIMLFATCI